MRQIRSLLGAVLALGFVACDRPEPVAPSLQASVDVLVNRGSALGSGQYSINGLIVDFAFDAEQKHDDKAVGKFSVYTDEGDGLIVDFTGIVTCLAIDEVNHRAWIGGGGQNNRSTDAAFDTPIHRPGHDIWFRVLDLPAGDRSTFIGFEGAAGFATSADYCAGRPWPDNNARTWPVIEGGLEVRP